MSDILNKILAVKAQEVAAERQVRSEAELLKEAKARKDVRGFGKALETKVAAGKPGVIAEIKKASPSTAYCARFLSPLKSLRLMLSMVQRVYPS